MSFRCWRKGNFIIIPWFFGNLAWRSHMGMWIWLVGCKRAVFKRVELEWTGHNLMKAIWGRVWWCDRSKNLQWHVHMFLLIPHIYSHQRYKQRIFNGMCICFVYTFIPLSYTHQTALSTMVLATCAVPYSTEQINPGTRYALWPNSFTFSKSLSQALR